MKAEWSNKDSIEMPTTTTIDYIKREDAQGIIDRVLSDYLIDRERTMLEDANAEIGEIPPADVVEVGKAYPREEFEKYGLSEWKDKDGQRWVMIERKDDND